MHLGDFDALSFDCYGTLIDWEHGLRHGLDRVAMLTDPAPSIDALLETYAGAEAETERSHPSLPYPSVIAQSIIATGMGHGIVVPEDIALSIGTSVPSWPAFPDSPRALERLHKRYKLIILSNVDRESFASSNARLGVEFDAVLTAEDIGSYKPDRRNFEALTIRVESMDIPRNRLLHVAQSLFHDLVPAKAAGLSTVWIDRRHGLEGSGATPAVPDGVQPDWTFTSLAAFADAVD
ncbi:MAG TPA: HAD family hydrolase, partial [Thermomicrobiales bacterium]|nr:HAD family hydrolase [Thermomicrobiales bacterium]